MSDVRNFARVRARVLRRTADEYGLRPLPEIADGEREAFPSPSHEEYQRHPDLARAIPPNALAERNPERLGLRELLERDGITPRGSRK